jgi:UDP-glucuronate 4-epimerase
MKTVLLTGCAGFIGSTLLDRLLKDSYRVIGVDNFNDYYDYRQKQENISKALKNKNFKLVKKDILDLEILDLTWDDKEEINLVIHLAARAGVRPSIKDPLLYEKVNCQGTLNILELMRKLKIKKMIFGSSSSVYGNLDKVPFQEDSPTQPISPYGVTKRSGELMCQAYSQLHGMQIIALRFFTVYGPRNRPDMAAYKFTKAINEKEMIEIYGKGTARDFTYVDDIVEGIVRTIEYQSRIDTKKIEIINLGNSSPITVEEFIGKIEKIVGKKAKVKQAKLPPGDVRQTYAGISKAKKLLGWEPGVKLNQGLKKLWQWFKSSS